MPAYLSEAARDYNHIRRIHPNDSISQLGYYRTSSSSFASRNSSPRAAARRTRKAKRGIELAQGALHHRLSRSGATESGKSKTIGQKDARSAPGRFSGSSSMSSSYSSKLMNLMLVRREESDVTYSSGSISPVNRSNGSAIVRAVGNKLTSSGRSIVRNLQGHVNRTLRGESKKTIFDFERQTERSPPFDSSGFSDETLAGTTKLNGGSVKFQQRMRNSFMKPNWANNVNSANFLRKIQSENIDQIGSSLASMSQKNPIHPRGVTFNQNNSRHRRRKINRINRRMLVASTDAYGNPVLLESPNYDTNPYALSEMFSQSEIPGFREIFASDSYLRKFCWVIAFLGMTMWSLHDATTLISDYVTYPVTVDVRLVDTARLPFPAVTVCNLNVVRYSGLCSSHFELASQIPRELRDKLCGIQVDKKKNSTEQQKPLMNGASGPLALAPTPTSTQRPLDVDISDINNIGISSTSATQPTTDSTGTRSPEAYSIGPQDAAGSFSAAAQSGAGKVALPRVKQRLGGSLMRGESLASDSYGRQESLLHNRFRRSIILDQRGSGRPFASNEWRRHVVTTGATSALSGRMQTSLAVQKGSGDGSGGAQLSKLANSVQTNRVRPAGQQQQPQIAPASSAFPSLLVTQAAPASGTQTTLAPNLGTTFSPPSGDEFELTERQERELQENLTNWLAVMHQLNSKLTRSIGHQFDDMILRCTMKSINCTRESAFEKTFTPTEGNCFTYRSKGRIRNGARVGYEEANLAGINDGLELVLNLEKSEYITGSSQVGALVMVHYPDEQGYAAGEATLVAPEFTTYIGLKMVNITRLPDPYPEHCVDSWPAQFRDTSSTSRNATYSQQTCLKMCLQKSIQTHCACQSAFLPPVDAPLAVSVDATGATKALSTTQTNGAQNETQKQRVIICDTRKRQTRLCVRDVNLRVPDRVHNCECPAKCHSFRYDKTISVARWPTDRDRVSFDRGKADVNFQNLAKVIVYFQTMTREEVTQQAVYTAAKFTSSLGGIMGMYVGFSFLSVFEIIEVMSRKLWHYIRVRLGTTNWLLNQQQQHRFVGPYA